MRLDASLETTEHQLAALDTSSWATFAERVADDLHPEQRDFALDPARYIVACVGRGGGKTTGGRARFVRRLLTTPGARCVYLAKTRDHAKRLMWLPLKELFKQLGFTAGRDLTYNETSLTVTMRKTGALLRLCGADKPSDIESLRGESFHEVGIDEAGIHPDALLTDLIRSIIGPRLLCSLWLIGTPGRRLKGLFYEVSRRGSKLSRPWKDRNDPAYAKWRGWSFHRWSLKTAIEATADRPIPALLELYAVQQAEIADQGLSDENPVKRREYDGEWAADDMVNVYRYRVHNEAGELWNQWDPERIGPFKIAKLPGEFTDWCHVVAIDLGFSDPTAINVFAFSPSDTSRTVYHRLCFEQKGMHAQMLAHKLVGSDLNHEKPGGIIGAIGEWPNGMIADSAHQMAAAILAELANVYGITIEPAQKGYRYKLGAIDVLNGDLVDGRLKVLKDSELESQMLDLQWAESRSGEPMERKDQPNHCLVAGTMVASEHGDVPIERVRAGDMVWTRRGLRRVLWSGPTGVRPVWRFEVGERAIVGTADHPIWTQDGWKDLALLTQMDTVTTWANTDQALSSSSRASSTGATQSQATERWPGTTSHRPESLSIGTCGLPFEVRYRTGGTCTTRTATTPTTESTTSSSSKGQSIIGFTAPTLDGRRSRDATCSNTPYLLPRPGTDPRKARPGTPGTPERPGESRSIQRSAPCAASTSCPRPSSPRYAGPCAMPVSGEKITLATTSASVTSASVNEQRSELVYDLTVEGEPEFFANGILVHNSSDCALYARIMIANFISAGTAAQAPDPQRDPRSPNYEPPMPDAIQGDYSGLFQDDYAALLG